MCHNQEAHGVPEILPTISCFCYYFSIFLATSYISCVSPSTPTETPVSNLQSLSGFVELSHFFPILHLAVVVDVYSMGYFLHFSPEIRLAQTCL